MALSVGFGAANVLLDLMFVGKLHMGIAGSALGTGIGLSHLHSRRSRFFLRDRGGLRFKKAVLSRQSIG